MGVVIVRWSTSNASSGLLGRPVVQKLWASGPREDIAEMGWQYRLVPRQPSQATCNSSAKSSSCSAKSLHVLAGMLLAKRDYMGVTPARRRHNVRYHPHG